MRNTWTILRRDLGAYFTSPIGYIVIIVFLAISVGLYITTFFAFPVADMRGYFANLPLMLCILIPAITMRVWAEERKENTWEMLLTFPMKSWELVLGKFLATLIFLCITLACTFTIPLMLRSLGNPDMGAILSGYIGTLLLGAFFLSVGIFFSGFCKDQIVAFVVTLLACFLLFLLGTNLIAGYINNLLPEGSPLAGLGVLLMTVLGVIGHFDAFTRGVIELGDILFFIAWTVLFLALNIMYIDARNRPGARAQFVTAIALCAVIGLSFNWLVSGASLARFDMTEDKAYTISPASRSILSRLDDTVQINLYITPRGDMPVELARLEQDVQDKLSELRIASGGRLDINTIHLRAANVLVGGAANHDTLDDEGELGETRALEDRMLEKGIEPFTVQTIADDAVSSKLVYSHLGIAYSDQPEEIIPQIVPQVLPELEYRLVSTIYKMTRETPPVVVVVAPEETVNIPAEQRRMLEQFGQPIPTTQDPYRALGQILGFERYEYRRVALTQDDPLPAEFDTLVIVNPRELNERQRWEVNRALASGKSVVLAVQNHTYDYRFTTDRQLSVVQQAENPGANELLEEYGLRVSESVLMDVNTLPLSISTGDSLTDFLGGGRTVNLATHIMLTHESMNPDLSITSRLSNVFYLWGSALELDAARLGELGLDYAVLMETSPHAANRGRDEIVMTLGDGGSKFPLMVMVQGQFPDLYAEAERPDWPEMPPMPGQPPQPPALDEPAAGPLEYAPGKLILLGAAMLWRDDFIAMRGFSNLDLFLNAVDAVSLTDEIVDVRGAKPIDRMISRPPDGARRFWQFINFVAVNASIAGIGLAGSVVRKRSREAYTVAQARQARGGDAS